MPLDQEAARRIARLAHLELEPGALHHLVESLSGVVDLIESLSQFETADPDLLDTTAPCREAEDRARPGLDRDLVLANAPETLEGTFRVPRMIDRGRSE